MKLSLSLLFVLVSFSVFAQDTILWSNLRSSAVTENNEIYVRCEDTSAGLFNTELYYTNQSGWNMVSMENYEMMTMQSIIPYDGLDEVNFRLRTAFNYGSLNLVVMMPAWLNNSSFPTSLSQISLIAEDMEGDCAIDVPDLDIVADYCAFSENSVICGIRSASGEYPYYENLWGPYYYYMAVLANPESVVSDSVAYAMIYANTIGILNTGLYKIGGFDISEYAYLGEIDSQVIDNTLVMSCDFNDLLNDPDFGDWPNSVNSLAFASVTSQLELPLTYTFADSGSIALLNLEHLTLPAINNNPPTILNISYSQTLGITTVTAEYTDLESNFPLIAEMQIDGNTFIELSTDALIFDEPAIFTGVYAGDWNSILVRFSDNGFTFTDSLVQFVSVNENEITPPTDIMISPNPVRLSAPTFTGVNFISADRNLSITSFSVYNLKGQEVFAIDDHFDSGKFTANWHCNDEKGDTVPSGIYLIRINRGKLSDYKKLIILR